MSSPTAMQQLVAIAHGAAATHNSLNAQPGGDMSGFMDTILKRALLVSPQASGCAWSSCRRQSLGVGEPCAQASMAGAPAGWDAVGRARAVVAAGEDGTVAASRVGSRVRAEGAV